MKKTETKLRHRKDILYNILPVTSLSINNKTHKGQLNMKLNMI